MEITGCTMIVKSETRYREKCNFKLQLAMDALADRCLPQVQTNDPSLRLENIYVIRMTYV